MDRKHEQPNGETVARWVSELPRVEADPAFRDALRARFASGELAAAQTEPERGASSRAPNRSPRPRRWGWLAPAAAGALALAILILNRGPALRVVETTGAGFVNISGRDVALDDMDALNAGMKTGARIEVPSNATVDLMIKDVAMVELAGGTEVTLPTSPGRWFGRAMEADLFAGEIRLKTGVDFAGNALRVTTPEGVVEVTGTLLSVQCDASGTCVCVLKGVAHAGIDEGDMEPVPPGFRKIMLRNGTVGIVPIEATHRDGVVDFDKRVGGRM
jgi:ferric-dicitrate binding protein FerR (iron transport regulator)